MNWSAQPGRDVCLDRADLVERRDAGNLGADAQLKRRSLAAAFDGDQRAVLKVGRENVGHGRADRIGELQAADLGAVLLGNADGRRDEHEAEREHEPDREEEPGMARTRSTWAQPQGSEHDGRGRPDCHQVRDEEDAGRLPDARVPQRRSRYRPCRAAASGRSRSPPRTGRPRLRAARARTQPRRRRQAQSRGRTGSGASATRPRPGSSSERRTGAGEPARSARRRRRAQGRRRPRASPPRAPAGASAHRGWRAPSP